MLSYKNAPVMDLPRTSYRVIYGSEISKTARDRRAGSLGYAEVMVMEYNKRNNTHALRHEQLYSNKGKRVMIPFAPPENESDGDNESAYIEENAGFDETVAAESEAS